MQSEIIFDYHFQPNDFATFEGVQNRFRVRILDIMFINTQKFYLIQGPKELMLQEDYTEDFKGIIGNETWLVNIADPDELSLPEKYLRRVK